MHTHHKVDPTVDRVAAILNTLDSSDADIEDAVAQKLGPLTRTQLEKLIDRLIERDALGLD